MLTETKQKKKCHSFYHEWGIGHKYKEEGDKTDSCSLKNIQWTYIVFLCVAGGEQFAVGAQLPAGPGEEVWADLGAEIQQVSLTLHVLCFVSDCTNIIVVVIRILSENKILAENLEEAEAEMQRLQAENSGKWWIM